MNIYELNNMLNNPHLVEKRIENFIHKKIIKKESSKGEIKGHFQKAKHNLNFIKDAIQLNYPDWAITGCYYACYHAALALILSKGYSSKSHLATLCILIKEFYSKELTRNDIELISLFLNYKDILFYVDSKNKRELASYSANILFDNDEIEQLRINTVMFVSKVKEIINSKI
ncbi:MAG: HEPN domain-containing protein [DPANN group archaeon]|nr:HEPN domain-containing protein [DPANN group archaeon]